MEVYTRSQVQLRSGAVHLLQLHGQSLYYSIRNVPCCVYPAANTVVNHLRKAGACQAAGQSSGAAHHQALHTELSHQP